MAFLLRERNVLNLDNDDGCTILGICLKYWIVLFRWVNNKDIWIIAHKSCC